MFIDKLSYRPEHEFFNEDIHYRLILITLVKHVEAPRLSVVYTYFQIWTNECHLTLETCLLLHEKPTFSLTIDG
jgi:hypothetical protein